MTMRKFHSRRKRRTDKQALRYGKNAKARHQLLSGRTGHVHAKKVKS